MEDDRDDLDDLFEEYESNDPQPQENVNNENAETDAAEKVPVPKRVVKHPRLKFNPERLCGKRGIPILVDHFKDVKFKGKGHEKEDLKKLLTTLELWTHRLFPSMKFEDCLRQIEHLGKKRPVKTCVQKIRLDFPILDKDFVRNEDEEEEHEQPNELEHETPAEDAFDRLFDDYRGNAQPIPSSTPSSSQAVGNVLGTSFGASISEEQKKRMEYNKMLAIERRKARLSAIQSSSLTNSTDIENTANSESIFDSSQSERRDDNDANSFIDYLHQQFMDPVNSSVKDKESETDEIMVTVQDNDGDKTDNDTLSNIQNNERTENIFNEELGLDELMDLVDEDDKNEIEKDSVSNFKTNEGKGSQSNQLKELEESKGLESFDEDYTCHDAQSNIQNVDTPNDNNKANLGLDELMDLVQDETDQDELSHVKNDDEKCSHSISLPLKDRKESERIESFDTDEASCNTVSNVDKAESRFDEFKDSVDKDDENEASNAMFIENSTYSSDEDERFDSRESENKNRSQPAFEVNAGFPDQPSEKTDD